MDFCHETLQSFLLVYSQELVPELRTRELFRRNDFVFPLSFMS